MLAYYTFPLLSSAIIGPILILAVGQNRRVPGAQALIGLLLAGMIWSLGYAAEIASSTLASKLLWAKFQYMGITTLPLAWFVFANQYLGTPEFIGKLKKHWRVMAIVPGITLGLVISNEAHMLVWKSAELIQVGEVKMLVLEHGPVFWLYLAYSYLLLIGSSTWLIRRSLTTSKLHRRQVGLVMAGTVIPFLFNFGYISGITLLPYLDLTPFGFIIAALFFSLSLFRYHMVEIVPVAYSAVFNEMSDGIFILDARNRVIDMNECAKAMIIQSPRGVITRPVTSLLPELAAAVESCAIQEEQQSEITLTRGAEAQYYILHLMPLTEKKDHIIGRLAVLHDISQRKAEENLLKKSYEELETRVLERTEDLRNANLKLEEELEQRKQAELRSKEADKAQADLLKEITKSHAQLRALTARIEDSQEAERRRVATELHDRVGQYLTALSLNVKSIQNKLPPEAAERVRERLEDSQNLVEATTRQVRSVIADLNPPLLDEYGLLPALNWYAETYKDRTGISVKVQADQPQLRMPPRVETTLFRIVQEGLNNVAKHAGATQVGISITITREMVCLSMKDDGKGFDLDSLDASEDEPHWGLLTMKEQAISINGRLVIHTAPGKGTQVDVEIRRMPDDNFRFYR